MKTLDCRGMVCPKPLILVKKELNRLALGDTMLVLIDNETSKRNVERFLHDFGVRVTEAADNGLFTLTVHKATSEPVAGNESVYCAPPQRTRQPHVICITSETMGDGPAELGSILMKAFVNTIQEVAPLPSHIVLYNSGVKLAVEGSALVSTFKELSGMGVSVFACGTCLDYFGVKNKLAAGEVSNMYSILEVLTAAGHIVKP